MGWFDATTEQYDISANNKCTSPSNVQGRYFRLDSTWQQDPKQAKEALVPWIQASLGSLGSKEASKIGCARWTCVVLFDAEDDGLDYGIYLLWNPNIEYQDLPTWMLGLYQRKDDSLGSFLKAIILG
jgi:hypothetical protein